MEVSAVEFWRTLGRFFSRFDHSSYKPTFSSLADVAQVVYLDHRGQGRSERVNPAQWQLSNWADDVKDFCDALEITKPVVMGNSFGRFVAIASPHVTPLTLRS